MVVTVLIALLASFGMKKTCNSEIICLFLFMAKAVYIIFFGDIDIRIID